MLDERFAGKLGRLTRPRGRPTWAPVSVHPSRWASSCVHLFSDCRAAGRRQIAAPWRAFDARRRCVLCVLRSLDTGLWLWHQCTNFSVMSLLHLWTSDARFAATASSRRSPRVGRRQNGGCSWHSWFRERKRHVGLAREHSLSALLCKR